MKKLLFNSITLGILCSILSIFFSNHAAADTLLKNSEMRVNLGIKLMGLGVGELLPLPVTATIDWDVGRFFRAHGEYTHHIFSSSHRGTLGAGAAFTPIGKRASQEGGFQLKLPILAEVGVLMGEIDDWDGPEDDLKWVILGPTTGVDFTWWSASGVGFNLALLAGYMFRIDVGSDYKRGTFDDAVGFEEVGMVLGVAF